MEHVHEVSEILGVANAHEILGGHTLLSVVGTLVPVDELLLQGSKI